MPKPSNRKMPSPSSTITSYLAMPFSNQSEMLATSNCFVKTSSTSSGSFLHSRPVVHEHAGQLLADGFRAQRGNHGGVHAAGKAQDHAPPTCARMAAMESMFQFASSPQTPNRKFFSSSLP